MFSPPLDADPPPAVVATRLNDLGLPLDAPWAHITTLIPIHAAATRLCIESHVLNPWTYPYQDARFRHGDGYHLDLFGLQLGPEVPEPDGPWWQMTDDASGEVEVSIALWSQRARYRDSPIYAELRWRASDPQVRAGIHGLEHPHTTEDLQRAQRGLQLLRRLTRRGPKPGSRKAFPTRDAYVAAIQAMYARSECQVWEIHNIPGWKIAQRLGMAESTLYECNKAYGISLEDIRQRRL
jgi:hypothetical protein